MINVSRLGKKYVLRHQSASVARYEKLSDTLIRAAKKPFRLLANRREPPIPRDEFWAIKDVNFHVAPGEVIGIIGRNGSGKSTLLKLLSRITEPSAGRIDLRGRIASLLEVGTGFHPELSGRENIFLNGAILGMSRAEIKRKFDEIVDFAEVERFLDTPVKRYSSGMYVRLAFAVAAHLEPEILIVDEVLAVGDVQFQKKCLGKMTSVAAGGRTILFVSHNMAAVERLCTRGLLMSGGTIVYDGGVNQTISRYMETTTGGNSLPAENTRPGNGRVRLQSIRIPEFTRTGDDLSIGFRLKVKDPITQLEARASIYAPSGECICSFANSVVDHRFDPLNTPEAEIVLTLPALPLNEGSYTMNVSFADGILASLEILDVIENAAGFQVVAGDPFGTGRLPSRGNVVLPHHWRHEDL